MVLKRIPMHRESPWRIFAISALVTIVSLVAVLVFGGLGALAVALVLVVVEVAFSFDNAIVNAKILKQMSSFWQNLFLTVGAVVAIFGMRIVFPILLVALTASLGWGEVVDLALHHPDEYAEHLDAAHTALASFGGAFLMVLSLDFFMNHDGEVRWLTSVERSMNRLAYNWAPPLVTLLVVLAISWVPFNHDRSAILVAGLAGIATYSLVHGLSALFGRMQKGALKAARQVGGVAFMSFMYLQVLDATFSFDSVLGAFAVTQDVVLIAIGLGVGAFWVRSLTVFMVRRGTLDSYRYIEHGAHYTIGVLACLFFLGLFVHVSEVIIGLAGLGIIVASIMASRKAKQELGKS